MEHERPVLSEFEEDEVIMLFPLVDMVRETRKESKSSLPGRFPVMQCAPMTFVTVKSGVISLLITTTCGYTLRVEADASRKVSFRKGSGMIDGFPLSFFLPLVMHALAGLITSITGVVTFSLPKRRGRHHWWGKCCLCAL